MAEKKTFKNPKRSIMTSSSQWDSLEWEEKFSMDEWDMEITFTKKYKATYWQYRFGGNSAHNGNVYIANNEADENYFRSHPVYAQVNVTDVDD